MSLRLPSEIVVDRFLPTTRAMLVEALVDRGMTQQEIADRLGVTQAAVSKHANGAVALEDRFLTDERMQRTVDRIAEGLLAGSMDDFAVLAELLTLVREFEDRGPICAVHEEEMPGLRGLGCDLCIRGTDGDVHVERAAIASVRRAARLIQDEPGFASYVPNVGTNVGMALPDASDSTDVVAIPGRIYEMRGQVQVPAEPEFGASKHVATTLLAANAVDTSIRGALNLATVDELLSAARDLGIEPIEFDPAYEERAVHLRSLFEDRGAVPAVVYHRGAFAIEPVTYVLGETAIDATELAASLVRTS